jgi:hypothetical protein
MAKPSRVKEINHFCTRCSADLDDVQHQIVLPFHIHPLSYLMNPLARISFIYLHMPS